MPDETREKIMILLSFYLRAPRGDIRKLQPPLYLERKKKYEGTTFHKFEKKKHETFRLN